MASKKSLWNEEKYYKYRYPHPYTHTRNSHSCTHKGRKTVHNSTKIKPKSVVTDSVNLLIPSPWLPSTSHNPFLLYQSSTTLLFSDMSSGRTEGHPCNRAWKTFIAHCPVTMERGITTDLSKTPGLVINSNTPSWEITLPKSTQQPDCSGHPYKKWGGEVRKLLNLIKK